MLHQAIYAIAFEKGKEKDWGTKKTKFEVVHLRQNPIY